MKLSYFNLNYTIATLISLLLFIFPIPSTISIRYIIIFILLILSLFLYQKTPKNKINIKNTNLFLPALFFVLLIFWSILGSLTSHYSIHVLDQVRGQLMTPLLIAISIFLIISTNNDFFSSKKMLLIVFISIFIHVSFSNLVSVNSYIHYKHFLTRSMTGSLTTGLDDINYITAFLLAILTVESIFRINFKKSFLPFDNFIFLCIVLFSLFGFIFVQAKRHGILSIIFLFVSFFIINFLLHKKRRVFFIFLSISVFLVISTAFISFKKDPRWSTLIETIPIAWDVKKYTAWKYETIPDYLPSLKSNRKKVNGSNYLRVAWISEGINLIRENPLGYGFSKGAFGKALKQKYPNDNIYTGQAHSGIIDLGIGTGIVGILLWLLSVGSLIYLSLKSFIKHHSYFALLTFFISTGFGFRMFVDGIFRDHILQEFIFLVVLFSLLTYKEIYTNEKIILNTSK